MCICLSNFKIEATSLLFSSAAVSEFILVRVTLPRGDESHHRSSSRDLRIASMPFWIERSAAHTFERSFFCLHFTR